MQTFSRINIGLVVFNACLLLGIAYLWYPTVLKESSQGSHTLVEADRTTEGIFDEEEVVSSSQYSDEDAWISSASTSSSTFEGSEGDGSHVSLDSLPKMVNLPVPFTSQAPEGNWDQPWQDACEEAAILMLDAFYKGYSLSPLFAKDEIQKMVDWQTERGWGYSIPLASIQEAAEAYIGDKFQFVIKEDPTVDDLKRFLAQGHPVYIVAEGTTLDNPYFTGDGPEYHALILRGYTDEGFITNDPGTKNGNGFVYTYDNLMESIHDWNNGNVSTGNPVVLLVIPKE